MLSPQVTGRLVNSRVGGMISHHEPMHFRYDEPAPDYRVNVEYLGRLEIAVSGRFTRKLYRFSPVQPVQQVDPRDAFYLLASKLFGVAS